MVAVVRRRPGVNGMNALRPGDDGTIPRRFASDAIRK